MIFLFFLYWHFSQKWKRPTAEKASRSFLYLISNTFMLCIANYMLHVICPILTGEEVDEAYELHPLD